MNFEEIYKHCAPYTITSYKRMQTLFETVEYINKENIEGSFVECGVYKGGSVMNMALTQKRHKRLVHMYLYDTFEGMTKEGEYDINREGVPAGTILKNPKKMCVCSLPEVKKNMMTTGYPPEFLHYRKGDVAETLHDNPPRHIALLRLDTDWYESTKKALEILYPNVVVGGVVIFDDYGYWKGARKAIDEYFVSIGIEPKLKKIDEGEGAVYLVKE